MSSDGFGMEIDINKVEVISKIKRLDKKYGKIATVEVKKRDPFLPPVMEQKLRESLPKMRAITASDLALKNDVRISTIKRLLKDLVADGKIEVVSHSRRITVYRGVNAKK